MLLHGTGHRFETGRPYIIMKHLPFTPHGKVKNVLESKPDDLAQALADAMMDYAKSWNLQPNSFQELSKGYSKLLKENTKLYLRIAELKHVGMSDELIAEIQNLRAHLRNVGQYSVSDRLRDILDRHQIVSADKKLTD